MSEFTNFSCEHGGSFSSEKSTLQLTVQLLVIFIITLLIVVFNVGTIIILHSKKYSCHLRELPKTLMTSLSVTDLAMGLLITPVCFISLAKGCFFLPKVICEVSHSSLKGLFSSQLNPLVFCAFLAASSFDIISLSLEFPPLDMDLNRPIHFNQLSVKISLDYDKKGNFNI